jgi:large subunit ribosomal protein L10
MARPEKTAVVDEIRTKLDESDAAVLTEYRGLTVTELAQLRGTLRPSGTEYKVFKNSLARRAVEAAGLPELVPMLEGPVAIAFVHGDAVVAAKALRDFGRTNPALVLKGGLLGPRVLSGAEVHSLADIEPRDVLLARLAGGFQAPLVKAAGLFSAFTRNFAYGIKAYVDQRVAGGETLPEPVAEAAPVVEVPAADEALADNDAEQAAADGVSPDAASEAIETIEENTTESENTNAEQASADGVSPDAASEAEEMES